jgi:hypothetical protein
MARWEEAVDRCTVPPEERESRLARYSRRNPQLNRMRLRNAVLIPAVKHPEAQERIDHQESSITWPAMATLFA